jgi:hypothetical protein
MAMKQIKKSPLGLVALVLGMIAFASAVLPLWLSQIDPPPRPSLEEVVVDTALKIKDEVVGKLRVTKSENAAPSEPAMAFDWREDLDIVSAVLSVTAILLAVISFVKREDLRIYGSAVALGGAALAWQYLMMALAVIFIAILIGAVLFKLDFLG